MAGLVSGAVVRVYFPFSDSVETKKRPALILVPQIGEDIVVCAITTKQHHPNALSFAPSDEEQFAGNPIYKGQNAFMKMQTSWILPLHIATLHTSLLADEGPNRPALLGYIDDDIYVQVIDRFIAASSLPEAR